MVNLAEHILREFRVYAKSHPTEEVCALVSLKNNVQKLHLVRNAASDRRNSFLLDLVGHTSVEDSILGSGGELIAVLHSHVYSGPELSSLDSCAMEDSNLMWAIYSVSKDTWGFYTGPQYCAPLLGREYIAGKQDCYTLVQDWIRQEYGKNLPNFDRDDKWWKNPNKNIIEEHMRGVGLSLVGGCLRRGDILLLSMARKKIDHLAIYEGGGVILHQVDGHPSKREIYSEVYQKLTRGALRCAG